MFFALYRLFTLIYIFLIFDIFNLLGANARVTCAAGSGPRQAVLL